MDAKKLGNFISKRRKENNMTQAELADCLHVTDKAVSRWERGLGFPDINTFEPLAEALNIRVEELLVADENTNMTVPNVKADTADADTIDITGAWQSRERKRRFFFLSIIFMLCAGLCFAVKISADRGRDGQGIITTYAQSSPIEKLKYMKADEVKRAILEFDKENIVTVSIHLQNEEDEITSASILIVSNEEITDVVKKDELTLLVSEILNLDTQEINIQYDTFT